MQRLILILALSFAEIVMTSQFACGAVPRAFDAQQQDRAVHAYCAEWRKTQGKLNADQMNKRVLFRLEKLYPAVFPECRPNYRADCVSWLNALVQGLRRYGQRNLKSVCSNLQGDRETPEP